MTQNNLGTALLGLGQRESGTARLEEAVAAYRAALAERTRDRVPLQWAATQTNLGNALSSLGQRESGTARLEEAVAAYRAALAERTRDRVPLERATTQTNLGNALLRIGERESGTARLEEAAAAYRVALQAGCWIIPNDPVQIGGLNDRVGGSPDWALRRELMIWRRG
jgi:tetratricopeptide (TPR) repeat protein